MAAEKLVMRIRLQAFTNILTQPMAWFDFNKNAVGNLLTRLDRDAPLIKGVRQIIREKTNYTIKRFSFFKFHQVKYL